LNIIAAVDKNWAIGNRGQQLVSIPLDQKMFRDETLGKVIVMGRKTLESLPGGKPLYGRLNVVLSTDKKYQVSGAVVCNSIEQTMEVLRTYPRETIYVIGGQTIYEQFLPYCHTAYITYIDFAYSADTYFPDLDQKEDWKTIQVSDEQTYFDLCYEYRVYKKEK